eukprot:1139667-Pelagomonas_calceolata.AAC.4
MSGSHSPCPAIGCLAGGVAWMDGELGGVRQITQVVKTEITDGANKARVAHSALQQLSSHDK